MEYYNLPSIANPANGRLDFEVGWLVEIMKMNMKLDQSTTKNVTIDIQCQGFFVPKWHIVCLYCIQQFALINVKIDVKYGLMVCMFLSCKSCDCPAICIIFKTYFLSDDMLDTAALSTGLALIGKATVVSCFCCIFIYSSEIFPTVIRTVAVGACAFWGRVGSLLAPQILLAV